MPRPLEPTRLLLAALWTAVMLNIAFADLVGFVHPGALQRLVDGDVGFTITPALLLVFSLLLEVPIAMIVLSLLLPAPALRWATAAAAALTTLFVVGGGSATPSYVFFAAVEVVCMAAAAWLAWRLGAAGRKDYATA